MYSNVCHDSNQQTAIYLLLIIPSPQKILFPFLPFVLLCEHYATCLEEGEAHSRCPIKSSSMKGMKCMHLINLVSSARHTAYGLHGIRPERNYTPTAQLRPAHGCPTPRQHADAQAPPRSSVLHFQPFPHHPWP